MKRGKESHIPVNIAYISGSRTAWDFQVLVGSKSSRLTAHWLLMVLRKQDRGFFVMYTLLLCLIITMADLGSYPGEPSRVSISTRPSLTGGSKKKMDGWSGHQLYHWGVCMLIPDYHKLPSRKGFPPRHLRGPGLGISKTHSFGLKSRSSVRFRFRASLVSEIVALSHVCMHVCHRLGPPARFVRELEASPRVSKGSNVKRARIRDLTTVV